jgi:hypothetical protein
VLDGASGPALIGSGIRILNDGYAAVLLDPQQAGRAVVQIPGENDPNDTRPVALGRRAEEGIHGGAVPVFLGPPGEVHMIISNVKVMIGRGNVYPARQNPVSVSWVPRGERTGPAEDARERARDRAWKMHDDEDGTWKVGWKTGDEFSEHLDAACGPANDHYVPHYHEHSHQIKKLASVRR